MTETSYQNPDTFTVFGFSKIIDKIESQLANKYLPRAINWCDEHYDNAWSNAITRFDNALTLSLAREDYFLAKTEGKLYEKTILDLIEKFKTETDLDQTISFLATLEVKK